MAWKLIATDPPHDNADILVLDVETGEIAISSAEDQPDRRGYNHRNGFPATHWDHLPKPLPVDPYYRLKLQVEGNK